MRQSNPYGFPKLGSRLRRWKRPIVAPTSLALELFSIFPTNPSAEFTSFPAAELRWYGCWVRQQVKLAGDDLFLPLEGYTLGRGDHWDPAFLKLWEGISRYMKKSEYPCLDALVVQLRDENIFKTGDQNEDIFAARQLVFAVIGWQTMLYKIETGNCPPSLFAIEDEMDGYKGLGQIELRQDHSSCNRHIYQFLLRFGLLLPSSTFTSRESPEEKESLRLFRSATPESLNIFLLESIGNLKVEWVDSLTYHLELDRVGRKLYLYRFPSFCLFNIPSDSAEKVDYSPSILHACACPGPDTKSWATGPEITSMLQETILTYRLLFGQSKPSRRFFRKLEPFEGVPIEGQDRLLEKLCSRKRCELTAPEERDYYDLDRDFPMYKDRLASLHLFLSQSKPHTWKELWKDKRDSAQWFTFWAVLVLGGTGLFLALIQVVLQIVQLAMQWNE